MERVSCHDGGSEEKVWGWKEIGVNSFDWGTEEYAKESERVNKKRKFEQMKAEPNIRHLQAEWFQQVFKNKEIEAACDHLSQLIAAAK